MTFREQIKELFSRSQALLREYSDLCIKMQENHLADETTLEECDKKFKEYNQVIKKHHELILEVTKRRARLDQEMPEHLV